MSKSGQVKLSNKLQKNKTRRMYFQNSDTKKLISTPGKEFLEDKKKH